MSKTTLCIVSALLLAACSNGATSDPAEPAPTGQKTHDTVATDKQPDKQVARTDWPPQGPGCAELVTCCGALASDAQLFCKMSVAKPPVDCGKALGSVRTYLGERNAQVPPACQGAAAQGSGPSWVKLEVADAEGWLRKDAQDHGPEQGYIIEYQMPRVAAVTVYVYRGGVADISRDEKILRGELERTLDGMNRAVKAGHYKAVEPSGKLEMRKLGAGDSAPSAAYQRVSITPKTGSAQVSESYITAHRGFFFKVRISYFDKPTSETTGKVQTLLDALGATAREK